MMIISNNYIPVTCEKKGYSYNAPCKDCEDRMVGCHSVCQKYIDFKKESDERKARNKIKREYGYYLADKFSKGRKK